MTPVIAWFPVYPAESAGRYSNDLNIIPITLNYKYQAALTDRLNGFIGLGAGVAILDSSSDWSWSQAVPPPNNSGSGSDDDSEAVFYGNLFAGFSYDVSDSFEIFVGARYIFMDNEDMAIDFAGQSINYEAGIDEDMLVELGARYRF